MECVIDTNVLVDYILLDSELHEKAKAGLERIDRGFLPSVVLEELVQVLERLKFDKKIINEKIKEVTDSYEILSVGGVNMLEAQKIVMDEKSASFRRFNDKLILSIARQEGMPLLTFDRDLIDECKANGVKPFYD